MFCILAVALLSIPWMLKNSGQKYEKLCVFYVTKNHLFIVWKLKRIKEKALFRDHSEYQRCNEGLWKTLVCFRANFSLLPFQEIILHFSCQRTWSLSFCISFPWCKAYLFIVPWGCITQTYRIERKVHSNSDKNWLWICILVQEGFLV